MKTLSLNFLFFTFLLAMVSCTAPRKQPGCKGCDLTAIPSASAGLDKQALQLFFCSLQADCLKTNSEFGEVANEAVFKAIDKAPVLFLEVFEGAKADKQSLILEMLASPIHDGLDTGALSKKLAQLKAYPAARAKLLSALEAASGKR